MSPQAATELSSTSGSVDRGQRLVRRRVVETVKWGCSLTICFFLSTRTALAHEKWFHKGPWEPANWRNVAQFPTAALIAGVVVITIVAALDPPSSGAPQRLSRAGRSRGRSRRHYPLLCVGPRHSGDSCCRATSGVRHSRASVRPVPQSARRLAILARAYPSGRCRCFVLRWLDPSGRDRNRRGMVDWNWRVWPRADVGKQSLRRFCGLLLSRWTRTVFIDHLLFPRWDPPSHMMRLAPSALRIGVGISLVMVAFTEKLANPQLALSFLQQHPLNFTAALGMPMSDATFVLCAGSVELLIGLFVVFGLFPRLIILVRLVTVQSDTDDLRLGGTDRSSAVLWRNGVPAGLDTRGARLVDQGNAGYFNTPGRQCTDQQSQLRAESRERGATTMEIRPQAMAIPAETDHLDTR